MREHSLEMEYFWVILTWLPRICYTMEVALKHSKILDSCKCIQLHEDQILGTKYFKFRILVNVVKPLKHIFRVPTRDGSPHTGFLKYERIPNFCFSCGVIGRRYRNCPHKNQDDMDVKNMSYGPWMGGVDHMASENLFNGHGDERDFRNGG